jgi:HSP20 family molecular chaperone IbpA
MAESGGEPKKGAKIMVEDIAVTPFFARHGAHKSAEIKLHAELDAERDHVVLKTDVAGFHDNLIEVSAEHNTIYVKLNTGRSPKRVTGEARHEDAVSFSGAYYTPAPIDPDSLTVLRKGDTLVVKAKKA